MKKITLISIGLVAMTSVVSNAQGNWYIRGPFNDYNPQENKEWALTESSSDRGVFTGTFSIPANEFEINFVNPDGNVFVPVNLSNFATFNQTVEFTDNKFSGNSTLAWDDYEEVYMWKCPDWKGGNLSVTIHATTNNPKIEFVSKPDGGGDDNLNAPVLTDIITEVEGRAQNYLRYGSGYFSYMGYVYQYFEDTEPSPSTIVYGTDNTTIYFKDLMDYGWDSYVEGKIDGNKVTVKLPQTMCKETYAWVEEPYYHNLCVLKQTGFGSDLKFEYDESIKEVTYTIKEDGTVVLDELPDGNALGIITYFIGKVYDNPEDESSDYHMEWIEYWDGAADYTQKFVPLAIEMVEMPEGVEPITYYCVINGYNYPVSVAFQDDNVYIQGLGDSQYISNLVVKGTINGDKVHIPQNQYVGIYKAQNEMVITKCGYQVNRDIIYEPDDVDFIFNIDKDKKRLSVADKNLYFCFAYMNQYDEFSGQNGLIDYYKDFYLLYQESFPGVPSNPYGLYANDDFLESYYYHSFGFEISAVSTTGDILLTGNLYYSIYIDGELELFEYDPDGVPYTHYFMLPEPTTEIPFMFTNDGDLDIWTETERQVGYYYDGVTTMGVQAVYYFDDQRTVSDIVTLNLETGEVTVSAAGIQSPSIGTEVVSTEYFDLSGRRVADPHNGIFIKKTVMNDGKVISSKVAIR